MDKELILKYKKWCWLIPLLGFLLISYLVITNTILSFDKQIYLYISDFINPIFTIILQVITNMGITGVMFFITFLIYLKDHKAGKFLGINLMMIYLLGEILKQVFTRIRPNVLWLTHADGYSFPSGHSMVSFCFYGLCIYLLMKVDHPYKKIVSLLLVLLIILIGCSRIYLGVHYFSDVIGGFLFSLTYILYIINNFPFEA